MVRLFLYGLLWQQKIAVSRGTTSVSNLLYFVSGRGYSGLQNVLSVKYIPRYCLVKQLLQGSVDTGQK